MAISFGKNNNNIRLAMNSKFLNPDQGGLSNYDNFKFRYGSRYNGVYTDTYYGPAQNQGSYTTYSINCNEYSTYYTTLILGTGPRPEITNSGFNINNYWEIHNNPNVIAYWRYEQTDTTWENMVTENGDYLEFTPDFFGRKATIRAGTPTWFMLYTNYEEWEWYISFAGYQWVWRYFYGSLRSYWEYGYTISGPRFRTGRIDGVLTGSVGPRWSGADLEIVPENDLTGTQHIQVPYGMRLYRPYGKMEAPSQTTLVSDKYTVGEGETARITLTIDNVSSGPIPYTITGVTASDIDIPLTGQFILENNTGYIDVTFAEDASTEGEETFTLTLDNQPTQSINIVISDTSLDPVYTLSTNKTTVNEGESVTITLNTERVPDNTVIPYTITGVTADDIDVSLTGTFVTSVGTDSVTINVLSDTSVEPVEYMTLALVNGQDSIQITVNDKTPTYIVTADKATANEGDPITFTLTTTHVPDLTQLPFTITGMQASDFTQNTLTGNFNVVGNLAQVTFNIVEDFTTENTETLTLALDSGASEAVVTVYDTSVPTWTLTANHASIDEGGTVTFTLTTQGVADGPVPFTITGIQAEDLLENTLTGSFNLVSGTAQVSFTAIEDLSFETTETLTLSLDNGLDSVDVLINNTTISPDYPDWALATRGTPNTTFVAPDLLRTGIAYNGTDLFTLQSNTGSFVLYKHTNGLDGAYTAIVSFSTSAETIYADMSYVYVLTANDGAIKVYDHTGQFIKDIALVGQDAYPAGEHRTGLASDGVFFYVGHYNSGVIERYSLTGQFIDSITPNSSFRSYVKGLVWFGDRLIIDTDYDKFLEMAPGFTNTVLAERNTPQQSSYDITWDGQNLISLGSNFPSNGSLVYIHNGLNEYGV